MYKVMIIDDEAPARIAIRKLGHWADYRNTEFYEETNGARALKSMREIHPQIVFVDMKMPVMDGMEFLEKASGEFPESRFIIISGFDDFTYAKAAIKSGAVDYLLKPIDREELNTAIDRAVSSLNPRKIESPKSVKISPEEVITLIRKDIDEHYSKPLKISHYAKQYYFTQEYLTRLFRQHYQLSIQEYLLQVRMTRAKELLQKPDIKIQDIAARVGYTDNNYFSKAFRTYFGVSPTSFRSSLQKPAE